MENNKNQIRERVLHALKWSASAKFFSQLISWGITIVVIRLLTPADYGLMAIALLFINFTMMMNELGLGAALVQKRHLVELEVQQVFGFILLGNLLFFIILFIAAPFISDFFDEKRLILVVQVLAIQFLLAGFELVPMALLERDLDLKKKSIVQLAGQVLGGLCSLSLALNGLGVWSLVWGSMTTSAVRAVGMNLARPCLRLPRFSFIGMKKMFTFGSFVTGERVLWFFYNQADIFIIGKLLGKELLGIYSVAMHLSSLLMHKTGEVIYTVSFPAFAKVQSEKERTAAYLLKSVRVLSFIMFPVFLGMSAIADEIVYVLLGNKWEAAAIVLQLVCIVMPLRMVSNLFPPLLQGVGRPDISLGNLIFASLFMPIGFLIGTKWGLVGVSLAWIITFPLVLLIMLHRTLPLVNLHIKDIFQAMAWPLFGSILMYCVVILIRFLIEGVAGVIVTILILIISGVFVYVSMNRHGWKEVYGLLRSE